MEPLHYATCLVWVDAEIGFCTCPRPWRIRKSPIPGDPYAWRVERRTDDCRYELFMRASSYTKAVGLVVSLTSIGNKSCLKSM